MKRQVSGDLVSYQFESLAVEGIIHAIFTRLGGVSQGPFSSLNVGNEVGDDEADVAENHARILTHLSLVPAQVATAHQVHGNHIEVVTAADGGRVFPSTDGLVTATPGVALLLRFADCQPILLYDPTHHALGLVHAGWRGLAQGIARRAVEAMQEAFDTRPEELIAGLGPAIGPCCYTVGDNVAGALGYGLPHWRRVMKREGETWRLDLPAANAQQLAASGVLRVEQAGLCTASHPEEFFSHRQSGGHTGRFAVVAVLESRPGLAPHVQKAAAEPSTSGFEPESLQAPGLPTLGEGLEP